MDDPTKENSELAAAWNADPREILRGHGNHPPFVVRAAMQFCRVNYHECPPHVDVWQWLISQSLDMRENISAKQRAAFWRKILRTWAKRYNIDC